MKKGKIKNQKKYISIMIVPHFASGVKAFKISALYYKLLVLSAAIVAAFSCLIVFSTNIYYENKKLKRNIYELSAYNMEQKILLEEKVDEISYLLENQDNLSSVARDFIIKYQQVTETYITGRLNTVKTNRSAANDDRSFVNDLKELRGLLDAISKAADIKGDTLLDLSKTEQKLKEYLDSIPDLWPVAGTISSDYGYRKDPFVWKRTFHDGIDIVAPYGENIKAAASGKVIAAYRDRVFGNTVIIEHTYGLSSMYGHASKILVKKGQKVNKGDIIAKVGNTGRSTGTHLHFEIRSNGTAVNPHIYLDR